MPCPIITEAAIAEVSAFPAVQAWIREVTRCVEEIEEKHRSHVHVCEEIGSEAGFTYRETHPPSE